MLRSKHGAQKPVTDAEVVNCHRALKRDDSLGEDRNGMGYNVNRVL